LAALSNPARRATPRPVITYAQAIPIVSIAVVLGLSLGALHYSQSRFAAYVMVMAVGLVGAAYIRLLGLTVGPIVLLIVTCFVDQWVFSVGRFNIRPEQVAVIVGLGALVLKRIRNAVDLELRPNLPEVLLLGWFAIGLVSSLVVAQDRGESLKILALLVISAAAMVLPRRLLRHDQALLDQVIAWLLLAFAVEAAYALAAYFLHLFGPTVALTLNPASGHLDAQGTMWEPNVLGAVCGAGAIAWLVLGSRHFHHAWIGSALCLTACVASLTRSAWLAVLLLLILGVATPVRHRIDLRALGAGLLATLILTAGVVVADSLGAYSPGGGGGVVAAVGNGTDLLGRLRQVEPVLQDLKKTRLGLIFGGGIDSFGQRHLIQGGPEHLASLEVTVINDTGLLGSIVFAAFGLSIAMATWRARHDLTVIGLGGMVLLVALTNTATQTLELMITWLLIGLLLGAVQVADSVSAPAIARKARDTAA
jgi:hypothetical protein